MLGCLEMDVDKCIAEYSTMIQDIFEKGRLSVDWKGKIKGRFDTDILVESIKGTLQRQNRQDAELFNDGKTRGCRV